MRSSTFAVVSDRQLRLRAMSKRNTTVVCSRLCADARGIQNRGKRKPERRVPNATFDNLLSHGCSPSMALAQCALGCKPQMCGRLLQEGCNVTVTKTKRAYRTAHAHHRGEIRPKSRPKPSRVWQWPLRVGWAESASPIRPDIPGCLSRNATAEGLPSGTSPKSCDVCTGTWDWPLPGPIQELAPDP